MASVPSPLPTAEAEAQTYAMGRPTQAVAEPGRPTEREPDRPKPRRTGARRKKRKPVRAAWLIAGFAGLIPVLVGGTWLIARDDRPADPKAPEVKPPVSKPAAAKTTQVTAEPAVFPPPPPPPPGGPRPGMPGYGPPPGFGPGSPGFGPPSGHPFPPPKQ